MFAVVAGPSVSISATTPPAASSRLISPARPDSLLTAKVWVPGCADRKSRAQPSRAAVTATTASAAPAAGSAATSTPAATAGTATSTPAMVQVRCPASRSHQARAPEADNGITGTTPTRPARTNNGTTTTRYATQATTCSTVIFGASSVTPVTIETHHDPGATCAVRSNATQ